MGKYILRKEGLLPLVMEGISFLKRHVFLRRRYDLYEMPLNEPMQFDPAPEIQDFVFELVPTSQRLDELVAQGFDFGIHGIRARRKLDKGGLMFCIFIAKGLACIHWAATTQEAEEMISRIPIRIDYLNNEVYLGWSETTPKYRNRGLSQYLISEKLKFFMTMGGNTGRWAVEMRNRASQRLTIKIGGRIYGEGRYLRILGWNSWKEKLVDSEASQPQST